MTIPTPNPISPSSTSNLACRHATANGCFRKIFGGSKRPKASAGWALEISLDIEWAHAIAPKATILLVEATTNSLGDLLSGVDGAQRRLRCLDELDRLRILERIAPG